MKPKTKQSGKYMFKTLKLPNLTFARSLTVLTLKAPNNRTKTSIWRFPITFAWVKFDATSNNIRETLIVFGTKGEKLIITSNKISIVLLFESAFFIYSPSKVHIDHRMNSAIFVPCCWKDFVFANSNAVQTPNFGHYAAITSGFKSFLMIALWYSLGGLSLRLPWRRRSL